LKGLFVVEQGPQHAQFQPFALERKGQLAHQSVRAAQALQWQLDALVAVNVVMWRCIARSTPTLSERSGATCSW